MMFHREKKIVIYTPMKCGSTTIETALRGDGWYYVMAPTPWDATVIEKHTDQLPYLANFDDVRKVLLVRHPFARVRSLFNHDLEYNFKGSFDEWMFQRFDQQYCDPCSVMYPNFESVIRLEFLIEDLAQHGIEIDEVPHENRSRFQSQLPEKYHDAIRERYASDFRFYPQ